MGDEFHVERILPSNGRLITIAPGWTLSLVNALINHLEEDQRAFNVTYIEGTTLYLEMSAMTKLLFELVKIELEDREKGKQSLFDAGIVTHVHRIFSIHLAWVEYLKEKVRTEYPIPEIFNEWTDVIKRIEAQMPKDLIKRNNDYISVHTPSQSLKRNKEAAV